MNAYARKMLSPRMISKRLIIYLIGVACNIVTFVMFEKNLSIRQPAHDIMQRKITNRSPIIQLVACMFCDEILMAG